MKNISLHWLQGIFETVPKWSLAAGSSISRQAPGILKGGFRGIMQGFSYNA